MKIEELGIYAPYILVAIAFFANYGIFVTPNKLDEKLKEYVLKETYNVAVTEIKNDIIEIKSMQAKIYDKLMNG